MASASPCVANIGPRERRRRLTGGFVLGAVTLALIGYFVYADVPRLWRLFVVFPAGAAALGFFQAHAQTCVALAAHGLKNMDAGNEPVADAFQLSRIRTQSRQVYVRSLVAAVLVTALTLF